MSGSHTRLWQLVTAVVLAGLPGKVLGQDVPASESDGLSEQERAELEALFGDGAASNPPAPSRPAIASSNPDLAFIFGSALSVFSEDKPQQVGAHDPNKTGFTFQYLELQASANVDSYFRFDANILFSQFGVEIEEAYGTTLSLPYGLQLRAGQFLTRFGRHNPTHPHSWAFLDQPLAMGKFFGGEGSRGLGVEASWLMPLPWYAEVVLSMNDAAGDCCARSMLGGDDYGIQGLGDFQYSLMLKQFWDLSPQWGLNLGLSLQLGPNASGHGNRTVLAGLDAYLRWEPRKGKGQSFDITLEALYRGRELPHRLVHDGGGYLQVRYSPLPEWGVAGRYEWVSGLSQDPLDPEWVSARQKGSFASDWRFSHFSRLRLQVGADAPSWQDSIGWFAMLGLELTIGAHGAHSY